MLVRTLRNFSGLLVVQVQIKTLLHLKNWIEKQASWPKDFSTVWTTNSKKKQFPQTYKKLKKLLFRVLPVISMSSINLLFEQHEALRNDPSELLH
jgi:hypothetical protein